MSAVLITGVGAIIGYGLARSLRKSHPDVRLIGTDIYQDAVGQAWCDGFEQAPLTASAGYLDWLEGVVRKHHVNLLIPGIEQDVHRLSDERDFLKVLDCATVLNVKPLIDLSRDKWLMDQELAAIDDPSRIPSHAFQDYDALVSQLGLPFILKPRHSYASKGLVRVQRREDYTAAATRGGERLIAQAVVGRDEDEYTVGIFGDGTGRVCASIALQRRLAPDGSTVKAWVRHSKSLDEAVARLCRHFKPLGPTNLQFRRDGEAWKLLEINPRVSSSTSIRTAFGYNEAAMSRAFFLHGQIPVQPALGTGFAVRFIEDYVIHDRDHF